MNTDFSQKALSLALQFYSRTLKYPYDELSYEFRNILREIEKNINTHFDNTLAASILDVINFYQGEDMKDLQAEFTRLFTPVEGDEPFLSLQLLDLNPRLDSVDLFDRIYESALFLENEDMPDSLPFILDYFSTLIVDDLEDAEIFFEKYLTALLPQWNEVLFKGSNLNFYKEVAKGLNELVYLLAG